MNLRLFASGILVGCAIGLMVGAATVQLPAEEGGERRYPFGASMLLAMVGVAGAMSVWRASGASRAQPTPNAAPGATSTAEPGAEPQRPGS